MDNLIASLKRLLARSETRPPQPLRVTEVSVTSADESFLARVQATVEERLGDSDLTVEGLANALACDRSYLLRKLRSLTGGRGTFSAVLDHYEDVPSHLADKIIEVHRKEHAEGH